MLLCWQHPTTCLRKIQPNHNPLPSDKLWVPTNIPHLNYSKSSIIINDPRSLTLTGFWQPLSLLDLPTPAHTTASPLWTLASALKSWSWPWSSPPSSSFLPLLTPSPDFSQHHSFGSDAGHNKTKCAEVSPGWQYQQLSGAATSWQLSSRRRTTSPVMCSRLNVVIPSLIPWVSNTTIAKRINQRILQ